VRREIVPVSEKGEWAVSVLAMGDEMRAK